MGGDQDCWLPIGRRSPVQMCLTEKHRYLFFTISIAPCDIVFTAASMSLFAPFDGILDRGLCGAAYQAVVVSHKMLG